jgi:hypothetical protein
MTVGIVAHLIATGNPEAEGNSIISRWSTGGAAKMSKASAMTSGLIN